MKIAYTMAPGRGDMDFVLRAVSNRLSAEGYRPAGTVQVNIERPDAGPCDMDIIVLPDGPDIRISQTLGRQSKGCRLDTDALETAVGLVETRLANSDCLIVNKFGKHEAEGRGFRSVIARALEFDLPVLVGVNALNLPAFEDFACGCAQRLVPIEGELVAWLHNQMDDVASVA